MNTPQQCLSSLLQMPFQEIESTAFKSFSAKEMADLFIDSSFLVSATEYLREGSWLVQKKHGKASPEISEFVLKSFNSELKSLAYLKTYFSNLDIRLLKDVEKRSQVVESGIIHQILQNEISFQNEFVGLVLSTMVQRFNIEALLQKERSDLGETLAITMYRTFDRLDEVLGLNYDVEKSVKSEVTMKERLYEGAGVGVQSSYSTLLTALREIDPKQGARFIDLGSGYGRVGLVLGFLRPDIEFIGYEYVPQRVEVSKESSQRLGLSGHVHFHTQDLSDREFAIPEADVYYLYDPFSEDTYKYVLNQLVEISRHRRIVIATKGNAKGWLKNVAAANGWPAPQEFSDDNLCLFRSYSV